MKLHAGHRVVIVVTGLAIGLRVLMPATQSGRGRGLVDPRLFGPEVPEIHIAATLLQVLGILIIGGTLFLMMPTAWGQTPPRKLRGAVLVLVWVLTMLAIGSTVSRTGLGLSLKSTNWLLTSAGISAILLLGTTTLGFFRSSSGWGGFRVGLLIAFLVVLIGVGLTAAQWVRSRNPYNKVFEEDPDAALYAPAPLAWATLLQIRLAYPEYNDLDDRELAERIIMKYPACRKTLEEVALRYPTGVKTIVTGSSLLDSLVRPASRKALECWGAARP